LNELENFQDIRTKQDIIRVQSSFACIQGEKAWLLNGRLTLYKSLAIDNAILNLSLSQGKSVQ